jgi:hypothetical protein
MVRSRGKGRVILIGWVALKHLIFKGNLLSLARGIKFYEFNSIGRLRTNMGTENHFRGMSREFVSRMLEG